MSGIAGSELLLLCIIGLMILGPERLPRVAKQLGQWAAKARQMTRSLQRQLEEEADLEKNLGFDPKQLKRDFEKELDPSNLMTPRDDDNYSPLHDEEHELDDPADEPVVNVDEPVAAPKTDGPTPDDGDSEKKPQA